MCGIIGLVNSDVSPSLYAGLYALQHRGQDSCGMLTCDNADGRFRLRKKEGLVSEVFDPQSLKNLYGTMGIGQTRYPTVGTNTKTDAQPFFVESPARVGIAHNGNVTNFWKLKQRFGERMVSTCDVEPMLHILADGLKSEGDIFPAVEKVMNDVKGSYSVVSLVPGHGLVIFRDPHAIRPLVLSKRGAASETIALDTIGETVVRDVKPGECIVINEEGTESRVLNKKKPAHCMFEWVYFSRPDSTIEKRSVYEARIDLGRELARDWDKDVDVVIPVPDTSRSAALGFSEESGTKYREGMIKNRYVGRTFIMPSQATRVDAVNIKLNPIINEVKGKRIALMDDSIVRGTTAKKIVSVIRKAGAKEVHLVSSCPPLISPCFYGVDMTKKSELIAAQYKPDELEEKLAKKVGADSVTYQTVDGLKKAIGVPDLCTACLTGEYPTDCSKLLERQAKKGRPYEE